MNNEYTLSPPGEVSAINADARPIDFGIDADIVGSKLGYALDSDPKIRAKWADRELNEIEMDTPGIVRRMFLSKDEYGRSDVEQAADLRRYIATLIAKFLYSPVNGTAEISRFFTSIMNPKPQRESPGLRAELIGPPIGNMPAYIPLRPLLLKQTATVDYYEVSSGQYKLEVEAAVNVGNSVVFLPSGNARVVRLEGSKTEIEPYFRTTNRYTIDFNEWATRLIKTVLIKKGQLRQELDKGWDMDIFAMFDAVVPNGSRYGAHPTHLVSHAGTFSADNFRAAARKIIHTDDTGVNHRAIPGVAVADAEAIFQIEDWGNTEWSEETVDEFNKLGFGVPFDGSVVAGKKVAGYSIVVNPLDMDNKTDVRFFARPEQVGYFVPVTFQGQRTVVRAVPMLGGDPNWASVRQSVTPPGFSFFLEAFEGGAMTIPGYFHIAKLYET